MRLPGDLRAADVSGVPEMPAPVFTELGITSRRRLRRVLSDRVGRRPAPGLVR